MKGKVVFILLVFVLIIFFILRIGLFNIKKIEIAGSQLECVQENQIKDSSKVLGQNFFLIDSAKLEDSLKKKFFCIKSAAVARQFPDKVKLQIFGRQPFAVLSNLKDKEASVSSLIENISTPSAEQVGDSYLVDQEGMVFAKKTGDINIPVIYIFNLKTSLGEKITDNILNSLKILEKVKALGVDIKRSWIFDSFFITTSDTSGLKIIFRLDSRIDIQLASLQLILDKAKIDLKELEFIDLRFDKPIVRFAPKK